MELKEQKNYLDWSDKMEIKFYREKSTFSVWIYYKKNNKHKFIAPVIQFSFVEPWYYPKIYRNYKGMNLRVS